MYDPCNPSSIPDAENPEATPSNLPSCQQSRDDVVATSPLCLTCQGKWGQVVKAMGGIWSIGEHQQPLGIHRDKSALDRGAPPDVIGPRIDSRRTEETSFWGVTLAQRALATSQGLFQVPPQPPS